MTAVRLRYALCWAAYWVFMIAPFDGRAWWWLLPYAGAYGYSDGFRDFAENCRFGRRGALGFFEVAEWNALADYRAAVAAKRLRFAPLVAMSAAEAAE